MPTEKVILVDSNDRPIGVCEKLTAHETGQLHRAISVFIFNSKNQMLLQRRALTKYHSGGLWTNACCSHPKPGELTENAASRRLQEEMGINAVPLQFAFSFIYKAKLDKGLIEHELDHVFTGKSDLVPKPDPTEVSGFKYISMAELAADLEEHPEKYTYWFKHIFDRIKKEAERL
ncbi:MAG: isopentenyl-diphosphate delta-isomerase [Bacteroidetes bacterium]|nr:isopentenyl-diphosphate delta-isomerase [Bacteroidota bacterium]